MAKSKDLFDESTMSFGEHLEVLRGHVWKAVLGLVICVVVALFFGKQFIAVIRSPIDAALRRHNYPAATDSQALESFDLFEYVKDYFTLSAEEREAKRETREKAKELATAAREDPETLTVKVQHSHLVDVLRQVNPQLVTDVVPDEKKTVELKIQAEEFSQLRRVIDKSNETVALNVQEAFITYLKVAFITGFVIASPWVFYQIWLFVAAGLYPHERKYVYIYLPMSLILFLGGAALCFFVVFRFVLDFLLGFNTMIGVDPQIRLSEWISFAIMLPVMFGLSFQLPLVMLFLERISIFETKTYREKRRMAILVIAIVSMLMTPADPVSMLLMMFPLLGLYELGIYLCKTSQKRSPFAEAETA